MVVCVGLWPFPVGVFGLVLFGLVCVGRYACLTGDMQFVPTLALSVCELPP